MAKFGNLFYNRGRKLSNEGKEMERKQEECTIPIKLSDAERLSIAHKAADLRAEINWMRIEASSVAKDWRERIKHLDDELCRFLVGVQSGVLEQTVTAERVIDRDSGTTWIEFAGARYALRELTAEERTEPMFE